MSRLVTVTDFVYGGVNEYTYDAMGRVTSETIKQVDIALAQTLYAYDDAAESGTYQKVTKTVVGDNNAPSIVTTQYTDRMGNVVRTGKVSNGAEYLDTYTYNYVGDLLTERTAATAQKNLAYTARYEYNGLGQAVKVYNALNQYTTSTYNTLGQLVQTTDYAGVPTTYTYDSMGRLLTQTMTITDGVTATSKYCYNPCGSITTELTPNQAVGSAAVWSKKEYTYDARQRLTAVAQYDGDCVSAVTRYTYDGVGNILSMTTGLDSLDGTGGSVTTYTYNRFGNVLTMTDSLGNTEQYTYSNLGLTYKKDRAGVTLIYAYDALGRTISISGDGGANTIQYTYAKTGATLSEANITTWETDRQIVLNQVKYQEHSRTTKTEYTYDSLGNAITVSETDLESVVPRSEPYIPIPTNPGTGAEQYDITLPGGGGSGGIGGSNGDSGDSGSSQPDSTELVPVYIKNYAYDLDGNRVYFQLAINGTVVQNVKYGYDALNRLTQVVENGGLQAAYTYDVNGNRATLVNGNGVVTNYQYNLANWVTGMSSDKDGETLLSYNYTYYASGTQKSKTDVLTGKTTSYAYDGMGRLTQESESGGTTLTYVYDRNSNRVRMVAAGAESYVVNYVYDGANRLLTEAENKNGSITSTSYSYDGNGSLLIRVTTGADGTALCSYTYDAFGRQVEASINGTLALYSYNAQGLRTGKTVGEQNTSFLLDGGSVVAETQDGSLVNRYVYGVNLVSWWSGSTQRYYLFNAHGDVVKLTTTAGTVTRSYDYDAFGNEKGQSSADANPFRYCGENWDNETETYYLRARYYDPGIGRFTQQDTHWNTANMIYGDTPQKINEREDALGLNTYTQVPQITAIMQAGNLYVYAVNNPVMYVDKTGESIILASIIIGIAAGAAIGGISAAIISNTQLGYVDGKWVLIGVGGGAVLGGLAGWGAGAAITAIGATATTGCSGTLGGIVYATWQQAEQLLRNLIGSAAAYAERVFSTPFGNRVVDAYNKADGIIAEAKYGYVSLTQFVQTQIAKDAYLLQTGQVNVVEWHFYLSQATGGGGLNMCISSLKDYEILLPPYPLEFDEWSKEKAADYLGWFVSRIPERTAYLYQMSMGALLPEGAIPPERLIDVWKWFLKYAETEAVPQQEIERQRQHFAHLGESFISKTRFTVKTEYLIRDIAMFMSSVFTTNYPNLYWDYHSKPKRYVYINQPVLKGFVNTRYGKPYEDVFQPVHMVHVQTVKLKKGKSCSTDLFDLFQLWAQDIP